MICFQRNRIVSTDKHIGLKFPSLVDFVVVIVLGGASYIYPREAFLAGNVCRLYVSSRPLYSHH